MDHVTIVAGLGLFDPLHLALSLNRKRELCASFLKNWQKSASLEPSIGLPAVVVSKLSTKNHKINNEIINEPPGD